MNDLPRPWPITIRKAITAQMDHAHHLDNIGHPKEAEKCRERARELERRFLKGERVKDTKRPYR